jgi:hypothetical protein
MSLGPSVRFFWLVITTVVGRTDTGDHQLCSEFRPRLQTHSSSLMQLRLVLVLCIVQNCIGAHMYRTRAEGSLKVPSTCVPRCCCSRDTNTSCLLPCRRLRSLSTADIMAYTLVERAYAAAASCACCSHTATSTPHYNRARHAHVHVE